MAQQYVVAKQGKTTVDKQISSHFDAKEEVQDLEIIGKTIASQSRMIRLNYKKTIFAKKPQNH